MDHQNKVFHELPDSWVLCSLGDLATYIQRGKSPKYTDISKLPVINQKSIRWDRLATEYFKYIAEEQQPLWEDDRYIRINDILWNSTGTGTVGRAYLVRDLDANPPKVVDSHVTIVRMNANICSKYAFYWISGPYVQQQIEEMCDGSTNQIELSRSTISETKIPLPPAVEQQRIVAKIEELFSELDKGVEALKTAQQQLKVYRQAVLKWAFEGKLTEEWRKQQSPLPTATQLLEQIKTEREKQAKATGKKLKPVEPITETELAELSVLPEGWMWIKTGLIIDEPKYGTSKKCDYNFIGEPVLRIPNIGNGRIDDGDLKYAEFDQDEIETYKLNEGDILLIRSNGSVDLVGKCSIITKKEIEYLFAGYLIRLRPYCNIVDSRYMVYLLSSGTLRNQIELKAKSTSGVNNINSNEIKSLIIPICDLAGQQQIVQEIESRLSVADKLEEAITQSLQQAETLRQSILKKAFEGRLVPQDPNDEPAGALLARIKAERENSQAEKAPRRQPRKTKTKKAGAC